MHEFESLEIPRSATLTFIERSNDSLGINYDAQTQLGWHATRFLMRLLDDVMDDGPGIDSQEAGRILAYLGDDEDHQYTGHVELVRGLRIVKTSFTRINGESLGLFISTLGSVYDLEKKKMDAENIPELRESFFASADAQARLFAVWLSPDLSIGEPQSFLRAVLPVFRGGALVDLAVDAKDDFENGLIPFPLSPTERVSFATEGVRLAIPYMLHTDAVGLLKLTTAWAKRSFITSKT